ncbi:MAG: hypothetical protein JW767_04435 [Thermoleophilia bacterium]|nr:hypothetical protein [Thermoleophilia bacterium]
MQFSVRILEIARDAKPDVRPTPAGEFTVSGETVEIARRTVLEKLAADGRTVRCLSFTTDGGVAVVAYPPAPAPPPHSPAARRRGGR